MQGLHLVAGAIDDVPLVGTLGPCVDRVDACGAPALLEWSGAIVFALAVGITYAILTGVWRIWNGAEVRSLYCRHDFGYAPLSLAVLLALSLAALETGLMGLAGEIALVPELLGRTGSVGGAVGAAWLAVAVFVKKARWDRAAGPALIVGALAGLFVGPASMWLVYTDLEWRDLFEPVTIAPFASLAEPNGLHVPLWVPTVAALAVVAGLLWWVARTRWADLVAWTSAGALPDVARRTAAQLCGELEALRARADTPEQARAVMMPLDDRAEELACALADVLHPLPHEERAPLRELIAEQRRGEEILAQRKL